jgi:deoxyribodipyrimidine photolyase
VFELLWRDYFRFVAIQSGNDMFKAGGLQHKNVKWRVNQVRHLIVSCGHAPPRAPFFFLCGEDPISDRFNDWAHCAYLLAGRASLRRGARARRGSLLSMPT